MKLHFVVFFALIFTSATAQHSNYNFSVFRNVPFTEKNSEVTQETEQNIRNRFPKWGFSLDNISGNFTRVYGPAIKVSGTSLNEKATQLIKTRLAPFHVSPQEWNLVKELEGPRANHVNYMQYIGGHKVVFSRLNFRFTKDGKLVSIVMKNYGAPSLYQQPYLDHHAVSSSGIMTDGLPEFSIQSKTVDKDWVWFPVPGDKGYTLHPAWYVTVHATKAGELPILLSGYIDGITGKLLYRINKIDAAFDVTVRGNIYPGSILTPPTLQPLANLMVISGANTYHTSSTGNVSIPSLTNVTADYMLRGKWVTVKNAAQSGQVPSFTQSLSGTGNNYTYPATGLSNPRMVNTYYHVDKIHDTMKQHFPQLTSLDFSMDANVDMPVGTCGAFFNPTDNSINFVSAGGGCHAFSEVADVICHEYGHAITEAFYQDAISATLDNPALNEACSDMWAMGINGNPVFGQGTLQLPGGGFVRRYNWLPRVYPTDSTWTPHFDGETIAGSWWNLSQSVGMPTAFSLFTSTYFDTPNGPWGMENDVFHEVLMAALLNDDNDANLMNGTPNFNAITKAFAHHGVYTLGRVRIHHNELAHQAAGAPIPVTASIDVQHTSLFTGVSLSYRNRTSGTWANLPMTNTTSNNYTVQIPAQPENTIIDYYISLQTLGGVMNGVAPATYRAGVPIGNHLITLPFQFGVGLTAQESNTFEVNANNWTVGNAPGDDATSGKWIHAAPVPSINMNQFMDPLPHQIGKDHTTGTGKCLVTGNAANASSSSGEADVDSGTTKVITPSFDLSVYKNPVIEYYRFFAANRQLRDISSDNPNEDPWVVQLYDGSKWITIDSTYRSDYNWRRHIFAVKEYTSNLSNIRLRFIASDALDNNQPVMGQTLVEAAIDDFFIYGEKTVGVEQNTELAKARVYPNPADERITVQLTGNDKGSAVLYDIAGRKVAELSFNGMQQEYHIATGQLAAGQYHLVISNAKGIQSYNVVVKHK